MKRVSPVSPEINTNSEGSESNVQLRLERTK